MAVQHADELFTRLQNDYDSQNVWGVGVAIYRASGLPIDYNSIFPSLSALETYVSSNPTAYAGQLVAVVESGVSTAYIINDDSSLTEIGSNVLQWGSIPDPPQNNSPEET